jgi:hypothetical protein
MAYTEMRIYKMYRDISVNELNREKHGAQVYLKRIQEETVQANEEAEELAQKNDDIRRAIKRYQEMIKNFDEEYKGMRKYAEAKRIREVKESKLEKEDEMSEQLEDKLSRASSVIIKDEAAANAD